MDLGLVIVVAFFLLSTAVYVEKWLCTRDLLCLPGVTV